MKVQLSIKKDLYQDLEILATVGNKTVSGVIREMLEEKIARTTIHELAVVAEAAMIEAKSKKVGA